MAQNTPCSLFLLLSFLFYVNGDYNCVCNYNVEIGVMPKASEDGQSIGNLYEFDCKENIESLNTDQWLAIAYDHKIGYVQIDAQTQQQICPGDPPVEDRVSTTTVVTTPTTRQPTTAVTTEQPTTAEPTTQSTTSSTTSGTTTTSTTTTPTTTSTTTTPTTTSTTTTPSTASTTTTPTTTSTTTRPTTASPTTTRTTTSTTTTRTTTRASTTTPTTTSTTTTPSKTSSTTTASTTVTTRPTTQSTTITIPTTSSTTTRSTASTTTGHLNVVSGKPKLCTSQLQGRVQNDRNILTQYDTSCYEIVTNTMTSWTNAESHCTRYGGHLVAINNQGEQLFITNFLKHNFYHAVWVGLDDDRTDSLSWSTGDQLSFTNWNTSGTLGSCVVLSPSDNGLWGHKICQLHEYYICEYGINAPQTLTTASPGNPGQCPLKVRNRAATDRNLLTHDGTLCYETVGISKRWDQAEQYCNANGGHLVTIDNADKQNFVYNYLNQNYRHDIWIGLTDSENEGQFEWASGKSPVYEHWRSELFPHMYDSFEDCTVLQISGGHWDDRDCLYADHYFMCEYRLDGVSMVTTPVPTLPVTYATVDPSSISVPGDLTQCPSAIKTQSNNDRGVLGHFENSCYELLPSLKLTYLHAEHLCIGRGGELVDILSHKEQAFMQAFMERYSPQHAAWIGLQDRLNETVFEWTSGASVSFTHWLPGHRNNFADHHQEDCVAIIPYKNGYWDDIHCGSSGLFGGDSGETHPPICEYKLGSSPLFTTPPVPTVTAPYATVDTSNITVPGDLNRCPPGIKRQTSTDSGVLGYYRNSCYELLPRKVTYQHAESMCVNRGGELVDILSSKEQNFVQAFMHRYSPQRSAWIGLHDRINEDLFEWTSGASVSYTNWTPGHRNNFVSHRQEDCVALIPYQNGEWDDLPCGGTGFFGGDSGETHFPLCEYKLPAGSAIIG